MSVSCNTLTQAPSRGRGPAAALSPWREFFATPAWGHERDTHDELADPFQIKATDAAAVSLSALIHHWGRPVDALVAAVHYGGDTDTIAAIVGEASLEFVDVNKQAFIGSFKSGMRTVLDVAHVWSVRARQYTVRVPT